ncbi:MAG: hypothetical protein UW00_C0030G0007 [Parcubacteria group bacterium GW2011_GWB1_43_66]|nr:MAG: hypothetical protein UW00_C0030G0007 [Parcubacteria group bacterium GW2011_GWB1_43_66]
MESIFIEIFYGEFMRLIIFLTCNRNTSEITSPPAKPIRPASLNTGGLINN